MCINTQRVTERGQPAGSPAPAAMPEGAWRRLNRPLRDTESCFRVLVGKMSTKAVGLEHCPARTDDAAGAGSAWSRDGLQDPWQHQNPTEKGSMRQGQAPHSSALWEGKNQWHQLKPERFRLEIWTHFFLWGQAGSQVACPERLCCLHPWRFFKTQLNRNQSTTFWSHSWACFEQEVGLQTSQSPFQTELSCDLTLEMSLQYTNIYRVCIAVDTHVQVYVCRTAL